MKWQDGVLGVKINIDEVKGVEKDARKRMLWEER